MANYLQGLEAGSKPAQPTVLTTKKPAGDGAKRGNGPFSRKIKDGEFAVSVEMLPPRGTANSTIEAKVKLVGKLEESGLADAVDITDGSRGVPLMPPGDFIARVRESLSWRPDSEMGLELVPHFTTRDLNVMGLQSRLVGYHAQRIHNVLFITGDPPKMSPDYPRSTAVFDVDSVAMVRYAHSLLNTGLDFGGRPLGKGPDSRTHFTIGSGFEPEAVDLQREVDKLRHKIANGVDYIMTQPTFRFEALDILDPFRSQVPILVGVLILTSLEHAQRMGQVPGVVVPQAVYDRMAAYPDSEDQAKAGREIAIEQIEWVREQGWAGLYLMSPASFPAAIDALNEVEVTVRAPQTI